MSKTLSYNFAPAPGASLRTAKLPLDFIPWDASSTFVKKQDEPDACIMTNSNSGVDTPCELTFGRQTIKNVYASTGINPAYQSANTTGVKILTKLNNVFTIGDSTNSAYRVDVPFSVTLTVTTGTDSMITDDVCQAMVAYTVASMFNNPTSAASVTSTRISAMRRGSLVPAQL